MTARMNKIYTIGYASYSLPEFIGVLKAFGVDAVADVRTVPYSRFRPEFNRDALAEQLKSAGIRYVSLGRECGARPDDPACYANGRVRFDLLAGTELFRSGIRRLGTGAERFAIAIMCAEQDPVQCHRCILVARELSKQYPELEIVHILPGRKTEGMKETESRLLQSYGLDKEEIPGLGRSRAERLQEAFAGQAAKIAWHPDNDRQEREQ